MLGLHRQFSAYFKLAPNHSITYSISSFVIQTFVLLLLYLPNNSQAATAEAFPVSTPQNTPVRINLTGRISGNGNISITIAQAPDHGTTEVQSLTILYSPVSGYVGNDRIIYKASDIDGEQTAQISITVGSTIQDNTTKTFQTPESEVKQTVDTVCAALGPNQDKSTDQQNLEERCNEFSVADGEEIQNALREIAPVNVAAQSRLGSNIMMQQLGGIARRLASLRSGIRGIVIGDLALNRDNDRLSLHNISASEIRGGSAGDQSTLDSKLGLFASGNFTFGKKDNTVQEDGFGFQTYGMVLGVDYRLNPKLIVGSALGYAGTGLNLSDSGGSLNVSSVNLVAYTTYYTTTKSYLDAIVTLNGSTLASSRNIKYQISETLVSETALGDTNSVMVASSFGGGYELLALKSLLMSITGRINYLYSNIGAYEETGAKGLNLAIHERDVDSLLSSLGIQLNYAKSFSWGVVVPQLDLNWEHNYLGGATLIEGHFVNDETQTVFAFETDNTDNDYFRIGLGATIVRASGASGFVQYETTLGQKDISEHSIALGARLEF